MFVTWCPAVGLSPCPEETEEEEEKKKKKKRGRNQGPKKTEKEEEGKIKKRYQPLRSLKKKVYFVKEKETTGCGGLITLNLLHNKKG